MLAPLDVLYPVLSAGFKSLTDDSATKPLKAKSETVADEACILLTQILLWCFTASAIKPLDWLAR